MSIISTVDVIIPAIDGPPYGVLEIDSPDLHQYDVHDIDFLTGFANVLATAVATAQRNHAMQAMVDQQALLAEELQHRVRNNLQAVSGMLANYARSAVDDTTRAGINAISRRVVTLAQIYDSLLGVGLSKTIDFGGYLRDLCTALPGLQDEHTATIKLECRTEFIMLPLESVTALGIVVAELVTNSYRHAFPDGEGTITVTLARTAKAGHATVTIRDSGVGFVVKAVQSRRGLGLVRRLIEQISGTLNVQSEAGTRWMIEFGVPVGPVSA